MGHTLAGMCELMGMDSLHISEISPDALIDCPSAHAIALLDLSIHTDVTDTLLVAISLSLKSLYLAFPQLQAAPDCAPLSSSSVYGCQHRVNSLRP